MCAAIGGRDDLLMAIVTYTRTEIKHRDGGVVRLNISYDERTLAVTEIKVIGRGDTKTRYHARVGQISRVNKGRDSLFDVSTLRMKRFRNRRGQIAVDPDFDIDINTWR